MPLDMTGNDPGPAPGPISAQARATLASNVAEFTVSEIAHAVKRTLEGTFERVRVRGEISRPNYHTSGHLYFTLKDADAAIDGVCWRGTVGRLGLRIEEGMEVVCTGRVSSYPKSSRYQLVVEAVELAGAGALLKLLEERRRKLAAEGLFDPARKRKLPFLPDVIGVVTSPTGAVIRDILHRLADRFPRHVLIWPVPVQGEGAAEKIAAAIAGFNAIRPGGKVPRPDLLIVARGGGSLEDLWAFNEEVVVRAAAASEIPLIAAVGHETDTTLIDFAADLRAPTPTAAAEMAVPVRAELRAQIYDDARRLVGGMARLAEELRTRLRAEARGLPDPERLLEGATQDLDHERERLDNACKNLVERKRDDLAAKAARLRHPREVMAQAAQTVAEAARRIETAARTLLARRQDRFAALDAPARLTGAIARTVADSRRRLDHAAQVLESLSYQRVLERGFVLVRDEAGEPVTAASSTAPGMALALRFHDGEVGATVTGEAPKAPRATRRRRDDGQGRLL
jgi:exodeoxyribonuclease VII large subunit